MAKKRRLWRVLKWAYGAFGAFSMVLGIGGYSDDLKWWDKLLSPVTEYFSSFSASQWVALTIGVFIWATLVPWGRFRSKTDSAEGEDLDAFEGLLLKEQHLNSQLEFWGTWIEKQNDQDAGRFVDMICSHVLPSMLEQLYGEQTKVEFAREVRQTKRTAKRHNEEVAQSPHALWFSVQTYTKTLIINKVNEASENYIRDIVRNSTEADEKGELEARTTLNEPQRSTEKRQD